MQRGHAVERWVMARRKNLQISLRRAVCERDGWRCKKCGHLSPDGADLEMHHIHEVADGGVDNLDNLDALCRMCHAEWTWMRTPPRTITCAKWLTIAPMYLVFETLLLGLFGLEIGIPRGMLEIMLRRRYA